MENIGKVKDELNQILVDLIEETVKVSDKYGLNRNVVARQMGEKIYLATNMSDFTTYQCKENEHMAECEAIECYEQEIRNKVIDEFAWKVIQEYALRVNVPENEKAIVNTMVLSVAERMKGGAE